MQLGVIPEINSIGNEFDARQIAEHQLVAVAAPTHPLAKITTPLNLEQLRGHVQIVWGRESASFRPTRSWRSTHSILGTSLI
ncbi:LysR substrate-binding domain-containing protein [Vibrio sp. PP-XX7]